MFQNVEESNIIKLNNNNKGNFNEKRLIFNTQSISSKIINYSNAHILFEVKATIPFANNDTEEIVKNTFTLRTSDDIIEKFKVTLNNVIVSDESNCDKSNLINFILNNSDTNKIDYRNLKKIDNASTINVNNNRFLITTNISDDNTENHEFTFKFPVFLKDINNFL